jgi:hypothetical protein
LAQAESLTGITVTSAVGSGVGNPATVPANAVTVLNAGQRLFVTEVFYSYTPMTPVGGFLRQILLPHCMTWRIFEENQVHLIRGLKAAGKESGQMMIMFALLLPLLFCFVGFGIDFGFAFLIKAQLAKACDAAALATMRNLGQGNTQATAIGQAKFALNAMVTRSCMFRPPPRLLTL